LEGFQTSTCLECFMGSLYPACDVEAFHATVTVQGREPKQGDSWFNYHAH
jgi:hypothetical protein